VKPLDFPLLTDENIAPDVVEGLRARGGHLRTAWDEQLIGRPDVDVLERATNQGRVVLTHDLAFGRSAIRTGTSFVAIIYLRPGHISAAFVLAVIDALRESTVEVQAPFIVVADWLRNGNRNLQHTVDHRQIDFQACSFNHSDIPPFDSLSLAHGRPIEWNQQFPDAGEPLNVKL
jgi:predicted nuclease of predicted toxin-antitoxin system